MDVRLLRDRGDWVAAQIARRGMALDLQAFREKDSRRLALQAEIDALRQRRNVLSEEVGKRKRAGEPADALLEEVRGVGERLKALEAELPEVEEAQEAWLLQAPNLPHASVPEGKDASENREVRRWGEPPRVSFEPRAHWEIGEALGILDFARAGKIAGSRFVCYRGLGARLARALMSFMVDLHVREHGYTEVLPPSLVNRASLIGTGQLPKFEDDLFKVEGGDYYLIPTAEVPMVNLHREEILEDEALPLAYVAATPCYRREAGTYGRDTRGLIRQHLFDKVELVQFTRPEDSYAALEALTGHAEAVLRHLGLPYRVVALCTGDLGFAAAKTYDLEVWIPSQGVYREISSCSNCEEFQARRAGIRYRPKGKKGTAFVHTLNGSGLAIGRTIVAILENYQQADGSVRIPEVLKPYLGGVEKISQESEVRSQM